MNARLYVIALSNPAEAARGTVRVLLEFADLAPLVAHRPCAAEARRRFPTWDGPIPSTTQLSDGSAGIVESSR